MRVRVDRGTQALHLELGETAAVRRVEAVAGLTVLYDEGERIVGVELHQIEPAALHAFTVELGGLVDAPTGAAPAPRRLPVAPPPPRPEPYGGPLTWDAEAEAAILQIPFFSRGRVRLAAIALARRQGLDRVTLAVVQAAGR